MLGPLSKKDLAEKWLPLTDSERLVSDVSKLLSILIGVNEGAEKNSNTNTYTSERQRSLKRCSDAVDMHNTDYDPQTAKPLAAQLANCLPNLA